MVDRFFPKDRIQAGIDAVLALPNGSSVRDIERLLGGRCDGLDVAIHLAWQGLIRLAPRAQVDPGYDLCAKPTFQSCEVTLPNTRSPDLVIQNRAGRVNIWLPSPAQ